MKVLKLTMNMHRLYIVQSLGNSENVSVSLSLLQAFESPGLALTPVGAAVL
jgi:hypothetical protein